MFYYSIIISCIIVLSIAFLYLLLIMPGMSRRQALAPFFRLNFAHRGLHDISRGIPENSMLSFREAVRHNFAIELDIHLTNDNKVVVFHDESLKRICHLDETVENSSYESLRQLYLSGTSERIPLLSEVLDYVDGRVPLLIELKLPSRDTRLCRYALELLENYKGPFLVQSFNSLGIRWFQKNAPQILRGQLSSALTRTNPENPFPARFCVEHLLTNIFCRPDFISYKLADADNLSIFLNRHLYRVPVAVWTLRDTQSYQKARKHYDMYIFESFFPNN